MSNKINNKFTSILLLLAMLLTFLPMAPASAADPDYIQISSVEDLLKLAENCSLDTWSNGKTVVLMQDLNLENSDFQSIPTFGGSFEGNGHTISGYHLDTAGSKQGFFRYLQTNATIKDLNVRGSVTPDGSKSIVGGIIGSNAGTILNCSFDGIVRGKASVGGIVGKNLETGLISGCSTSSNVIAEKATGGIVGKNLGTVTKCTSHSQVNTTTVEATHSLDDMDLDPSAMMEKLTTLSAQEDADTSLLMHTDSGGIAGYSNGIITGCLNTGTVGYAHMGYNVGGIAGRQAGYLSGCTNTGTLYGRKDVGGIVGQSEPYVIMSLSDNTLDQLETELNVFHTLLNDTLDDADASTDTVTRQLDLVAAYTDSAKDQSQDLLNKTQDFVDDNISEVNRASAILSDTLDQMDEILEDAEDTSSAITKALEQIEDYANDIDDSVSMHHIELAADDLASANEEIKSALATLGKATQSVSDAFNASNAQELDQAIQEAVIALAGDEETMGALQQIAEAQQKASTTLEELNDSLKQTEGWTELDLGESALEISQAILQASTALGDMSSTISNLASDILANQTLIDIDHDLLHQAFLDLEQANDDYVSALENLQKALNYVDISDEFQDLLDTITRASKEARSTIGGLKDLTEDLSAEKTIEFSPLSEDYRDTSNALYTSLSGISKEMADLNDSISSSSKTLSNDLRAVNDQFNVIMTLVIDALTDLTDNTDQAEISDYIEDTSNEDINGTRLGKVANSKNSGSIEADRNVGGIIGSMSIEIDLDPEDDVIDLGSINATYETKSVLADCINHGEITGKKDCIGGIVGRMDLGTVIGCENYASTSSTNGDYVGGVAGYSTGHIRESFAKCSLEGESYIGGIVGRGTKIRDCYGITNILSGEECLGAIAGDIEQDNSLVRKNYYVSQGIAGIDSISYSGLAEPLSFEEMQKLDNIPREFLAFGIHFIADTKTISVISVDFGTKIDSLKLPEIPEKPGYYSRWTNLESDTVTGNITAIAEYLPYVTVLASEETEAKSQKSLALAEGKFTDQANLHVSTSSEDTSSITISSDSVTTLHLSITGSDITSEDTVPIRLLYDPNKDAEVWEYSEGTWQIRETTANGQYLLLTMSGQEGTFCIVSSSIHFKWKELIGFFAVCLLLFVTIQIKRRKKRAA